MFHVKHYKIIILINNLKNFLKTFLKILDIIFHSGIMVIVKGDNTYETKINYSTNY